MGLGHLQVNQQLSHGFGAHAGAAVCMQREHTRGNVLLGHGLGDQLLGQLRALARRDHPAHDIAAEDIKDHVQMKVGPLDRAFDLGDVPAPDLVGPGGQQFGFGVDTGWVR